MKDLEDKIKEEKPPYILRGVNLVPLYGFVEYYLRQNKHAREKYYDKKRHQTVREALEDIFFVVPRVLLLTAYHTITGIHILYYGAEIVNKLTGS